MFRIKKLISLSVVTFPPRFSRLWSATIGIPKNTEKELLTKLQSKFSKAKDIQVIDISGGCGSMYEIIVESREFDGISRVKQHQMIVDALQKEIKDMHGIRIHTIVSK